MLVIKYTLKVPVNSINADVSIDLPVSFIVWIDASFRLLIISKFSLYLDVNNIA